MSFLGFQSENVNSICPFDPLIQNSEFCFIRAELEFIGEYLLLQILMASIELIIGISKILWERLMYIEFSVIGKKWNCAQCDDQLNGLKELYTQRRVKGLTLNPVEHEK